MAGVRIKILTSLLMATMRAMVAGTVAAPGGPEWDTGIGGATASMVRATGVGGLIAMGTETSIEGTFCWAGATTERTASNGARCADRGDVITFAVVKKR